MTESGVTSLNDLIVYILIGGGGVAGLIQLIVSFLAKRYPEQKNPLDALTLVIDQLQEETKRLHDQVQDLVKNERELRAALADTRDKLSAAEHKITILEAENRRLREEINGRQHEPPLR